MNGYECSLCYFYKFNKIEIMEIQEFKSQNTFEERLAEATLKIKKHLDTGLVPLVIETK